MRYLHVGCDEVFHMGECFRCRSKAREDLFLSHVKHVATYVRAKSPYTIPIIWDDMLRHLPVTTMQQYDIGKLVEPMVIISTVYNTQYPSKKNINLFPTNTIKYSLIFFKRAYLIFVPK